jgi:hypothetical protein
MSKRLKVSIKTSTDELNSDVNVMTLSFKIKENNKTKKNNEMRREL